MKKSNTLATSLLIALISGAAYATPVSIEGYATSENAVAVGTDSYATSISGVATGNSSVATGKGFTREQFAEKANENKQALDAVKNKQTEITNKTNGVDAANTAIHNLTDQINDLTNKQREIADKIDRRNQFNDQKDALLPNYETSKELAKEKEAELASFKDPSGKNIYLDFKDVLKTLNWSLLTSSGNTDNNRNQLSQELKQKVQATAPEIAAKPKYTDQKYRSIIDGFLNRQASYQGTFEYLVNDFGNGVIRGEENFLRSLYNDNYFNTALTENGYLNVGLDGAAIESLQNEDKAILTIEDKKTKYGLNINSVSQSKFGATISNTGAANSYYVRNTVLAGNFIRDLIRSIADDSLKEKVLNRFTLINESAKKLNNEGRGYIAQYNYIMEQISGTNLGDDFEKMYSSSLISNNAHNFTAVNFALKLTDNSYVSPFHDRYKDKNIGILSKIKDLTTNNANLISTGDITSFKKFYGQIKTFKDSINWNDTESAIDLTKYRQSLDKVIAYNTKINALTDLYQEVIDERKKSNANPQVIDQKTEQIIALKSEILDGLSDMSNFMQGIKLQYTPKAEEYLQYGRAESDAKIARINNELRLYDDKDDLIAEITAKAKEAQKAYDDAKADFDAKQKELDKINKAIDDLTLTEGEEATDDLKRQKEREKAEQEAEKARLENELATDYEELTRLKDELNKTNLRDLGRYSQAYGFNAFASGDHSIAMGSNATVTGEGSIGIGKDTTVKSNNAVALGNNITIAEGFDNSVVLGNESEATKAMPTASVEIRGKTHNFAGVAPTSTVSVGKAGAERQITHVAAGRITNTSTDAINGSQLYAVIDEINKLDTSGELSFQGDKYINVAKNGDQVNLTFNDSALNDLKTRIDNLDLSNATGDFTSTITTDEGQRQFNNGHVLSIKGDGKNIKTTVDAKTGAVHVNLNEQIAIKQADIGGVTINQNGIDMNNKPITNLQDGAVNATSQDAVTGRQLHGVIEKGFNVQADGEQKAHRKLGETVRVRGDNKNIRTELNPQGDVVVKMNPNIQVDSVSVKGGVSITENGIDAGDKVVSNVADGAIQAGSKEAVNGGQIHNILTNLHKNGGIANNNVIVNNTKRLDDLDRRVNKMSKAHQAGTASALASAGLPQPLREGQSGFSAGVGQYQGQTGLAVGYSRASDNGKWIFKTSVTTNTNKHFGGQASVGYFW